MERTSQQTSDDAMLGESINSNLKVDQIQFKISLNRLEKWLWSPSTWLAAPFREKYIQGEMHTTAHTHCSSFKVQVLITALQISSVSMTVTSSPTHPQYRSRAVTRHSKHSQH